MLAINVAPTNWLTMSNMGEEALAGFVPSDSSMFRQIRDVLLKHQALDKFGIYLIHKHFDIDEDEEMIEEVKFDQEEVIISPKKRSKLTMSDFSPTNWLFSDNIKNKVVVQVTQWGNRIDMPCAELDPFHERYNSCFAEIRDVLVDSDSCGRFGMFLLRHQFSFNTDENQLECTDQDTRTLTLSRHIRSNDSEQSIPTNWFFTPDETVAVGCCECARNSGGHLGFHRGK